MMWSVCLAVAMMQSDDPFHGAKWLTIERPQPAIASAKWIWVQKPGEPAPNNSTAPIGTVRLRREIELPVGYRLWQISFAADNRCQVSINGRSFWKTETWQQITRESVYGLGREGKNVIEVTASNEGGPAGLLFTAEATNGKERLVFNSDGGWTSPDGKVVELGGYDTLPWRASAGSEPCPQFYTSFKPDGRVKRAVARVIGLGHYDFYLNGKRQGTAFANQPWSQYDKTIYWQEFDITKSIQSWHNSVALEMGNGFYRVDAPLKGRYTKGDAMPNFGPSSPYLARVIIELELENGERQRILSDESWILKEGHYRFSHVFAGEDHYPVGLGPDWSESPWQDLVRPKLKVAEAPKAQLLKVDFPLLKAAESWKPLEIKNPKPGVWSYVFPQNASAFLRFKVRGPKHARVKFRPSEVISPEGEVQQLNLWGGEASCTYTLRGWPVAEEHEWRFWYHGFQFVEVTGAVPLGKPNPNNLPVIESLEMVHVRADNKQIGAFETSSALFNKIHNLVDWAMRSNMGYVMTDCPHREKLGWQEQVHLLFPTYAYRYDTQAWFRKIARDIRDAQLPDGRITTVAPDYLMLPPENAYKFTVEWGASGVLMPWQAYLWYGDRQLLSESLDSMKRFVDWIHWSSQNITKDGLAPAGLGDWYDYGHGQPPGPSRYTPTNLSATAVWAMCVSALSKAADVMRDVEGALTYRALHQKIKRRFLEEFYDARRKVFKNHGSCQTAHAMALCADLVPKEDRTAVLDAIVKDLEERQYQQTSGDIGHLFLIRALAEAGRSEVLHKIYSRTGVGSYGGILTKGLTTMPETWDAITVGSNSLNHCMLGHVMEWFYGWVVGIRQMPGSVGWNRILIAPEPGSLTWAKGETSTPLGKVRVDWKKNGHDFLVQVEVPKGAGATVVLPLKTRILNLDGKPTPAKQSVFGRASVEVGPGKHVIRFDA